MGKVCVAGAGDVEIDYHKGTLKCKGVTLREGDPISINGSTGEVFQGKIATADSELKQVLVSKKMKPSDSKVFQYYNFIMKLADGYRKLGPTPSPSGRKESDFAAPSICSLKGTGSSPSAR
jgi:pyruvate,orthophosphate dikinase